MTLKSAKNYSENQSKPRRTIWMWNYFIITQISYKGSRAGWVCSVWGCIKSLFYPSWMVYSREKKVISAQIWLRLWHPFSSHSRFQLPRSRQRFFWASSALFPHPPALIKAGLISWDVSARPGWTWSSCHHGRSHPGVAFPPTLPLSLEYFGIFWEVSEPQPEQPWAPSSFSQKNNVGKEEKWQLGLGFVGQRSLTFPGKPQNWDFGRDEHSASLTRVEVSKARLVNSA